MTNRSNIFIAGIVAVMFLGFSACTKDLSFENFLTHPINEITIEGLTYSDGRERTFMVAIGDVLTIEPELTFSLDPEGVGNYLFEWYVAVIRNYVTNLGVHATGTWLVSNERNLVLPIEGRFVDPRQDIFNMQFRVTDLETGIASFQRFTIRVQARHQVGWWILHETSDGFDISLVNLFQDSIFQLNHALDVFDSKLPRVGETPRALYLFPNNQAPVPLRRDETRFSAIVRTDRALTPISARDFSYAPGVYHFSGFVQPGAQILSTMPTTIIPTVDLPGLAAAAPNIRLYVHYNDNFYLFTHEPVQMSFLLWKPINRIVEENDWAPFRVAPFIVASRFRGAVMFDMDNRRFVRSDGGGIMLMETLPAGQPSAVLTSHRLLDNPVAMNDGAFSWTNGIESLRYMRNFTNHGGFAIIRDYTLNRYRYIQFYFESHSPTSSVRKDIGLTFDSDAFVHNVRTWVRHPNIHIPYLFAVTYDNRIWRIALTFEAFNNPTEITNQVLHPGYNITFFNFVSNANFSFQQFVTVGSYNPGGAAGANGRVQMFDVDTATGNLIQADHRQGGANNEDGELVPKNFTGFGKPVDVQWRFR